MDGHRISGERYRKIVRSVWGQSDAYAILPNFEGETPPVVSLVADGRVTDRDCREVLGSYIPTTDP